MTRINSKKILEEVLLFPKFDQKNYISVNRESPLSNFYPLKIFFSSKGDQKKMGFDSVEHYYSFNKFYDFLRPKYEKSRSLLCLINNTLGLENTNRFSKDNLDGLYFNKKVPIEKIEQISTIMSVKGCTPFIWEKDLILKVMVEVLCKKFNQEYFANELKATANNYIFFEDSSYDKDSVELKKGEILSTILMIIRRHI